MKMVDVDSKQIARIGFENGKLRVQFHSSPKHYYEYEATEDDHAALMSAESKGKHFGQNIKGRAFEKREG